MKAASLNEIRKELQFPDPEKIADICLRLARYKKENKELLTYLLFEAGDEPGYVQHVKDDVEAMFADLPRGNIYFVKKGLRKILRFVNRQIKYSGVKATELELRIHFCALVKKSGVPIDKSPVVANLYNQQIKKVHAVLSRLPEDLRFDYQQDIDALD
ncbi:MAG TPA: hypothetical protein VD816_16225 [Ohtaekwangia sp.]|nr:hypothetical protein [Ohtaekwangia sp.]